MGGVHWLITTTRVSSKCHRPMHNLSNPPDLTLDRYVKDIHTSKASSDPY